MQKEKWSEAAEKLARFEEAEAMEDVQEYCRAMCMLAAAERAVGKEEFASALEKAAAKIIQLSTFRGSALEQMAEKTQEAIRRGEKVKTEILTFLDEIVGQPTIENPVIVIKEKLEELL